MNVIRKFETTAAKFASIDAIVFENTRLTYQQLNDMVGRVGNLLKSLGIRPGDRVALFLPNIPAFAFAYLGILKIGAVAVSINSRFKREEVEFILRDCGASAFISDASLVNEIPEVGCPLLLGNCTVQPAMRNLDELLEKTDATCPTAEVSASAPCAILYTSGTTGIPKGVVLSHGNVSSNIDAACDHCGYESGQRMLLFLPMFHCFGQNAIMNCAFAVGATLVLHRQFIPEVVLRSIRQERVTHFYGVPSVYVQLLNMELGESDLGSIIYYFSAAAKMPAEISHRWWREKGLLIHEGYGLTETSPFSTYNHSSEHRPGSVGTAITGVEIGIVDENDGLLSSGSIGEIVVRGPNVMTGYWNQPESTADAMRNGWFHTGDIGYLDQDGYLFVTDRLKDMINIAGLKVYPAQVENVLHQHPAVLEAAVYGLPDELLGESVWADVILTPGSTSTEVELTGFCLARIASYKAPRNIRFVSSIPKNPIGKILKREIVAQHLISSDAKNHGIR